MRLNVPEVLRGEEGRRIPGGNRVKHDLSFWFGERVSHSRGS